MQVESQNKIAGKIGISRSYLSEILRGVKGCNKEVMNNILFYYPDLKFKLLNPRYIVVKGGEKSDN